jgi:bifunctional DNA-binding transcriptional regulator/antitoxin component of YhaV-PrlF toxin-antitoxin module
MPNSAHTGLPFETVSLGPEGEVRLPARLRHLLGWQEGDKLVLTADDRGFVKILTVHDAVRGVRGSLGLQVKGRLLADEVSEERWRETESSWRRGQGIRLAEPSKAQRFPQSGRLGLTHQSHGNARVGRREARGSHPTRRATLAASGPSLGRPSPSLGRWTFRDGHWISPIGRRIPSHGWRIPFDGGRLLSQRCRHPSLHLERPFGGCRRTRLGSCRTSEEIARTSEEIE